MMKFDIKGHSGCSINIIREGKNLFILKSSENPNYVPRLIRQAEKQQKAAKSVLQHIRVPKIHSITRSNDSAVIKMDYIYSRNFVEFFEKAGFEQVNLLIKNLIKFIEIEIEGSPLSKLSETVILDKFNDVVKTTLKNEHLADDKDIKEILNNALTVFSELETPILPIGQCHGDLTFSNILFNGNIYYLIDFLDSFIESPLMDLVKLRQDTAWMWSRLMYTKPCDAVRLRIAFEKIDTEIHNYFHNKYDWYAKYYEPLQLMNFLRILQYAKEKKVIDYLKQSIHAQIETIQLNSPRGSR